MRLEVKNNKYIIINDNTENSLTTGGESYELSDLSDKVKKDLKNNPKKAKRYATKKRKIVLK